jgi:hypothetical protein
MLGRYEQALALMLNSRRCETTAAYRCFSPPTYFTRVLSRRFDRRSGEAPQGAHAAAECNDSEHDCCSRDGMRDLCIR